MFMFFYLAAAGDPPPSPRQSTDKIVSVYVPQPTQSSACPVFVDFLSRDSEVALSNSEPGA